MGGLKVAVVGCTGLVGQTMLRVLEERRFPVEVLLPVASARSVGQSISFGGSPWRIKSIEEAIREQPQLALMSAGAQLSRTYAMEFVRGGCVVIDNSSCWRMEAEVPLVVPEVNADALHASAKLIANPNCSTIQMVVALYPLHQAYRMRRIVVSTYQSVSGSGGRAVAQLLSERNGRVLEAVYAHPIDLNLIPQVDVISPEGHSKEEIKMVQESRKILRAPTLGVSATCVRVPVRVGHSLSVNVEFEQEFDLEDIRAILVSAPGVQVIDEPAQQRYPMPLLAEGRDEVFVGRLRRDPSQPRTLNCWIVADNLRKGAATNAVQIAEYLLRQGLLPATG